MKKSRNGLVLFSGNGNLALSKAISKELRVPLGEAIVSRFSDGEINVDIKENVRGLDVFLIQPTCAPANENLMELVITVDAIRRSSAGRITAVIPYYGYGRQDRRVRSERMPISAKVMADIIENSGIDKIVTVELHSEQIQGFFHIPVDNLYGTKIIYDDIVKLNLKNKLIVAPDAGGVARSRALAKFLSSSELAIIDKRREEANESEVMNVIGEVESKDCIILDDIVDTADNSDLRLTLDYPEDLTVIRLAYSALSLEHCNIPYAELIAWFRAHPEIANINSIHSACTTPLYPTSQ